MLVMQYKTGSGAATSNWVDNTYWTPESMFLGSSLVWTGSAWSYNGAYGGCDGCSRNLIAQGAWTSGFRPSNMEITFTIGGTENGGNAYVMLLDTGSNDIISNPANLISGIATAGTYVKSFALDFSNNLDISDFGLFLGDCASGCTNNDRDWTLSSIVFT